MSPPPTRRLPQISFLLQLLLLLKLTTLSLHAIEPIRYVATGARIGVYPQSTDSEQTAFWHRSPHQLGGPVSEIQIGFMNWYLNYSVETTLSNAVTLNYAWLERASDGQIVPITFSGARSLTMPADDTEPYWLADTIASSVWTGGTPSRDEVFWLNVKGSIPASGTLPVGTPTSYDGSTSNFILYAPAEDPGSYDIAGAIPTITDQNSRTRGLPCMFLGRYSESGYLSVIGLGDSILDGSGDTARNYPAISGFGFFARAAVDSEGANTIATFNLTRHGASATAPTDTDNPRQQYFLQYANVAVEEYGTNDLGSGGTGDVSTIQARLEAIWQLCRDAGIETIVRTRLMPRTTSPSTYFWSMEDQTVNTGWGDADSGDSGKRDALNDGFETALAADSIDLIVDTLTPIADTSDDHYWLSNGTDDYMTSDGTHPSAAAYTILGEVLREALLTLSVTDDQATESYSDWADAFDWGEQDPSQDADPNQDGISNALAYALDLSPLESVPATNKPYIQYDSDTADGPWLNYVFRYNAQASEVEFNYLSTNDLLGTWSTLSVDNVDVFEETLDNDPDGDGSALLKQLRIKVDSEQTQGFIKLEVTLSEDSESSPITMENWSSEPWSLTGGASSFSATQTDSLYNGGTTATFTYSSAQTNVDISDPSNPDDSEASTSFFGVESSGFGVAESDSGYFERQESFVLEADHAFQLNSIVWSEYNGDESLHIAWTYAGVQLSEVFELAEGDFYTTTSFSGISIDANTEVTFTNVSDSSALDSGRLRIKQINVELIDEVTQPIVGDTHLLEEWDSSPWELVDGDSAFSGSVSDSVHGDVSISFSDPYTGVDVTNPELPDFSTATTSQFGIEGTGFGIGDNELGRFDSGESFTIEATEAFDLQSIRWAEYSGDESIQLSWTSGGIPMSSTVAMSTGDFYTTTSLAGIYPDADTPLIITNVSDSSAHANGRLRVNQIELAFQNSESGATSE
jgi:lysophospholipase L1-like esterase